MKRVRTNRPASTFKRPAGTLALLSLAALVALACSGWLGLASADAAAQKARKTLPGQKTSAERQSSKPDADKRAAWRRDARSRVKTAGEAAQQPNALAACVTSSINIGQTINSQLTADDCPFGDGTVFDRYTFNGTAGQQIAITLTSTQFDAYLFLVADDGVSVLNENDDGGGGTNSRIPSGSGQITLPYTGEYQIIANAFDPGDPFGTYTLTLSGGSTCPPSGTITAGTPVNGSLANGDCKLADETFYDSYTFSGTAGQQISISLNSSAFDAYLYLLDSAFTVLGEDDDDGGGTNSRIPAGSGFITLPFTGTYLIVANTLPVDGPSPTGAYTLTVTAAGGECPATPITVGQTINGTLSAGECLLPDETLYDLYTFTGTTGQQVAVSMNSSAFDAFLYLAGPDRVVIAQNDDGGGGTNSRIPAGSGFFTLPANGTYYILANTLPSATPGNPSPTGAYSVTLTGPAPPTAEVQFSAASYPTSEDAPNTLTVTVNRTGVTTGASVVNYATSNGTANDRSDYTAAYGKLRFAAGETSKTFTVFITDDAFDEADETFTVTLSNPVGATLGPQSTATVSIDSNDIGNGPSPVKAESLNAEFFVRQHYRDFLNRNADAGGLAFWVNQMSNCSNPPPSDLLVCRINVSAAFFLSIEFQNTGYLVYRTYKTAFNNLPGKPVPVVLRDFLADTRQIGEGVIVGTPGWPEALEANKDAYMLEFVNRADFIAAYPNTLTPAQFVDMLNANAGGALSQAERDQQVANLTANNTTAGRADVLRAVSEDEQLQQAEFNKAFVLMQYFGYLRRNPDDAPDSGFGGYNFWLGKLNEFQGNFINAEMVKAFITSIEYEQRFGQ